MCEKCAATDAGALSRRRLLSLGAGLGAGVALTLAAGGAAADDCAPFDPAMQAATTPDAAIGLLAAGNARFAAGQSARCDLVGQLAATAGRQAPFACVLSCIDSRVAPEIVFDQQIGDIFVARVAGNVATPEVIGSIEYATKAAGARAVVVLGHSHCGAVKGAVDRADIGANLTGLLDLIEPAIAAPPLEGMRSSDNRAFVAAVAETNVRRTVAAMTADSPVIAGMVAAGEVTVVGAMFDLETGRVRFLV